VHIACACACACAVCMCMYPDGMARSNRAPPDNKHMQRGKKYGPVLRGLFIKYKVHALKVHTPEKYT
jgi:hypothetical protein